MNILNKIKDFFSGKQKEEELFSKAEQVDRSSVHVLSVSPNVYLACRAAKLCIGKTVTGTITDRMKYIEKIVGMGHESILEHTNVVAMIIYYNPISKPEQFSEIIANGKYLDIIPKQDGEKTVVLIGGSIRAYMHLVRETDQNNVYLEDIKKVMYQSIEKCFLKSLIEKGLLDEAECNFMTYATVDKHVEDDQEPLPEIIEDPREKESKTSDLIYITDFDKLYTDVFLLSDRYTKREIVRMCHFTFLFHDISRSCGNQLCRHRNGITQESQRYVTHEYTKEKDFIDPIRMQLDDRYKNLAPNLIEKFNKVDFKTYKDMISAGIFKEDARAWLPMNVTTKIMMTFNGFTLAKFLHLRTAKGAQLEIRNMANEMVHQLFTSTEAYIDFIDTVLKFGYEDVKPRYTSDAIDEEIEIKTESFEDSKIDANEAERLLKVEEEYKNLEKN
jgi:flavin-dependent thymidylate synthase